MFRLFWYSVTSEKKFYNLFGIRIQIQNQKRWDEAERENLVDKKCTAVWVECNHVINFELDCIVYNTTKKENVFTVLLGPVNSLLLHLHFSWYSRFFFPCHSIRSIMFFSCFSFFGMREKRKNLLKQTPCNPMKRHLPLATDYQSKSEWRNRKKHNEFRSFFFKSHQNPFDVEQQSLTVLHEMKFKNEQTKKAQKMHFLLMMAFSLILFVIQLCFSVCFSLETSKRFSWLKIEWTNLFI